MNKNNTVHLGDSDERAVHEFRNRVLEVFPDAELLLYGSAARGDNGRFSDVDLLIVMNGSISREIEDQIYDLGYDVELEHGIILGIMVQSREFWDSELCRAMPLRQNIDRDGIRI